MGISKNEFSSAISAPIGLKFCTLLEGDNTQNRARANFKFPPLKTLAPLWIFSFALRPMGRKISNRLYSSFGSSFWLIYSGVLGWRCESLRWYFTLGEKFLTRFSSIFVCFTPPLIFPEHLKLASWNFHTLCPDDGAN